MQELSAIAMGGGGSTGVLALGAQIYGVTFSETKFELFSSFYPNSKTICETKQDVKSTSQLLIVN